MRHKFYIPLIWPHEIGPAVFCELIASMRLHTRWRKKCSAKPRNRTNNLGSSKYHGIREDEHKKLTPPSIKRMELQNHHVERPFSDFSSSPVWPTIEGHRGTPVGDEVPPVLKRRVGLRHPPKGPPPTRSTPELTTQ
jgi:hypothetical protein